MASYVKMANIISKENDTEKRATVDTVDQKVLNSMKLLQDWGLLGDNLYVDDNGVLQVK